MAFDEVYARQVALVVRALPIVAEEDCFALKGGTAINLFLRDMRRLSVDIDLAYLPIAPREESLREIDAAMRRIAARLRAGLRGSTVNETMLKGERTVYKLIVNLDGAQIVVEVTPVLRGCVYPPELRRVSAVVEEGYGFAEIKTLSVADLYGGKIVAALDRQHPRDLFDVHELFANEGLDDRLREAFIVYLISHNRPMHEVLSAEPKDMAQEFARGFVGMTREPVELHVLTGTRTRLVHAVVRAMPEQHRRFLVSFERGEPEWGLLTVERIDELPAVKWRMHNLASIKRGRREELVAALEKVLAPAVR
ncbi:MAG TPA: nucleotidyl transferase AbiEii/AbiGii toxin family protein [Gammaproteobacteria bacterium]|jgi:predicted nucleotidyltransferase component of viral defense system